MTGIREIDRTSLVIQCTRLEAARRSEDYRRAVWTVVAWAVGFASGIGIMCL